MLVFALLPIMKIVMWVFIGACIFVCFMFLYLFYSLTTSTNPYCYQFVEKTYKYGEQIYAQGFKNEGVMRSKLYGASGISGKILILYQGEKKNVSGIYQIDLTEYEEWIVLYRKRI